MTCCKESTDLMHMFKEIKDVVLVKRKAISRSGEKVISSGCQVTFSSKLRLVFLL